MIQGIIRSASQIVANSLLSKYRVFISTYYNRNSNILLFTNYNHMFIRSTTNCRTIQSDKMHKFKIDEEKSISTEQADCVDLVFVQSYPEKDSITISFNLTYKGKFKQFNLIRKSSEPLSTSLERIRLNLSKMTKPKKPKKNVSDEVECKDFENISLLLDNHHIDLDTKNIDAWIDRAIFKLHDKSYRIMTNAPQVESMKLPNCIMKNFIIIPIVNLVNCSIDNCKFQWFRQISAQEKEKYISEGICSNESITLVNRNYWYKIKDDFIFCPSVEDVGHYIKVSCKPSDGLKDGPNFETISPTPVELGPSECPFEKRHKYTEQKIGDPKKIRFMTYNILANLYADSDYSRSVLFGHCPSHALDMDYRRQLLLKEILGYNADIYCLQEVDKKEFEKTFHPFFHIIGNYSSVFDTKGGQVAEGEATFYNNDKFELIDSHKTLLSELIVDKSTLDVTNEELNLQSGENEILNSKEVEVDCGNKSSHFILKSRDSPEARECLDYFNDIRKAIVSKPELKKRFCDRHTIIQTTLLKVKHSLNDYLLIANTHLYFAPDADHIRLLQGSVCVKYLEYLKQYYKVLLNSRCSNLDKPKIYIILSGDMNSTPDCGLYKLLTQGKVESNLIDWSSAGEKESVLGLEVSTNLRFASAYENISYTNYTPGFNGCLDYIYYELDYMNCESNVPLPDHKDITAIGGIPSDVFPSDHLALVADIKLSSG